MRREQDSNLRTGFAGYTLSRPATKSCNVLILHQLRFAVFELAVYLRFFRSSSLSVLLYCYTKLSISCYS